jgi:hypothetical protein
VALHDIEPATFERCALIRDWLDDHGVDRVTLLVIPARDLHPLGERSPEMARWLLERSRAGDSMAQHGFQHEQLRRGAFSRRSLLRRPSGRSAEFVGLDGDETRRAVDAGRRLLKLAGIEPLGFVAPAYAYTPALREVLPRRFHWWAGLLRRHRPFRDRQSERRAEHPARTGMGHRNGGHAAQHLLPLLDPPRGPAAGSHAAVGSAPGRPPAPAPHDGARVGPGSLRTPTRGDHLRRVDRRSRRSELDVTQRGRDRACVLRTVQELHRTPICLERAVLQRTWSASASVQA